VEVLSFSTDAHEHDVGLALSKRLAASVAVREEVVFHLSVPRLLFIKAATTPTHVMHATVNNANKRSMNISLSYPRVASFNLPSVASADRLPKRMDAGPLTRPRHNDPIQ
jgi:hypothetical protein